MPGLVAPKVSEILAPREDSMNGAEKAAATASTNASPDTPVKRFVGINADISDEGTMPICEKHWADVVRPKVEAALKHIPVLDISVTGKQLICILIGKTLIG